MTMKRTLSQLGAFLVLGLILALVGGCTAFNGGEPEPRRTASNAPSGSAAGAAERAQMSRAAYRIGPEDVLEISVWQEEDLRREVLVRPDGGISFPLAGDVMVAGRTTEEVREELTRRIDAYIPDAMVNVSVITVSGYQIYVLGKVNNPGQFTVGRYVDVVQALTLAGGLTPFASERRISVIRRTADGEEVFPFNYADVKRGQGLRQNRILQSGDVVLVP